MTTIETLKRALSILQERGWSSCAAEDRQGRVCLRMSVMLASDGDDDAAHAALTALHFAGCRGGFYTDTGYRTGVEGWNDAPGRDLSEVIEKINLAMKREKSK